jgi:small-conductance mechanosensitive channel
VDFIADSFREDWQTLLGFVPRFVYAAVILLAFVVLGSLLRHLLVRLLRRRAGLSAGTQLLSNVTLLMVSSVGLLLALNVMGLGRIAASMLATGGVLAIVAGFAFREIGENLLAGIFLTFSRPFELGDLITTGNLTGVVRGITLRQVHIRTGDACDVYVPSAQIFREPVFNYTRDGLRRPSFTIGVAYDDEPERVLSLLTITARTSPQVLDDPAATVSVKEFAADYIEYEVFFHFDVTRLDGSLADAVNGVKIRCWRALREAGLTFSSDVSSALELKTVPPLEVAVDRGVVT